MGNVCEKTTVPFRGLSDKYEKVDISKFNRLQKIGFGGFAEVFRVHRIDDKSRHDYAMKAISKILIFEQKNIQPTLNEMFLLRDIEHPFLINMRWAFSDKTHLYLVMKELKGRDLRFQMNHFKLREDYLLKIKQKELELMRAQALNPQKDQPLNLQNQPNRKLEQSSFTENQTRFFVIQVCLALNYMHSKNIIHRDIKPENILLEEDGYICVTDLGIAKEFQPNNSKETSGTPGYMAPEVLCRQNHGFAVDIYAIGVIAYELMLNKRPYEKFDPSEKRDMNFRNELLKNVLQHQVYVEPYKVGSTSEKFEEKMIGGKKYFVAQAPRDWSNNGVDFINQCLQRKPSERIGTHHIDDVLNHPWFNGIDCNVLLAKRYTDLPFGKKHMIRSEKRAKVYSVIEEELLPLMKKQEEYKKQQEEIKRQQEEYRKLQEELKKIDEMRQQEEWKKQEDLQDQSIKKQQFKHFMEDEDYTSSQNENPMQQQQFSYSRIYGAQQQKLQQPDIPVEEKLKPVQHLFKHYYFDRDRYVLELKYIRDEKLRQLQQEQSNLNQRLGQNGDKYNENIIHAGLLPTPHGMGNGPRNSQQNSLLFSPGQQSYMQSPSANQSYGSPMRQPMSRQASRPSGQFGGDFNNFGGGAPVYLPFPEIPRDHDHSQSQPMMTTQKTKNLNAYTAVNSNTNTNAQSYGHGSSQGFSVSTRATDTVGMNSQLVTRKSVAFSNQSPQTQIELQNLQQFKEAQQVKLLTGSVNNQQNLFLQKKEDDLPDPNKIPQIHVGKKEVNTSKYPQTIFDSSIQTFEQHNQNYKIKR